MTTLLVSALHYADIVLQRRRQEQRMLFRFETPVDIREVRRSDLVPAIAVSCRSEPTRSTASYVLHGYNGRLWHPLVLEPTSHGGYRTIHAPRAKEYSGISVQQIEAMRTGIPRAPRNNSTGPLHDDPFARVEGYEFIDRCPHYKPPGDHPRLEDHPVKDVLWTDRPARENELRAAADRLLIVDGTVWMQGCEPVYRPDVQETRPSGRRILAIDVITERWPSYGSISSFRLDRLEEMREWTSGAGRRRFSGADFSDTRPTSRVEILEPSFLRRDDARWALAGRLGWNGFDISAALAKIRGADIDRYVGLRRAGRDVHDETLPTEELYAEAAAFSETLQSGVSGLDQIAYKKMREALDCLFPAFERWEKFERTRRAAPAPEMRP